MRHRLRRLTERYLNLVRRVDRIFNGARLVSARRCSRCNTNWPEHDDYRRCPECDGSTWLSQSETPLDHAEAKSRRNHALFERFYNERERKHLQAAADEIKALPEHPVAAPIQSESD